MAKKLDISQENTEPTNTSEPNEPLGPPELGPSASRKVPQLVRSTKSTKVEPVAPEEPQSFEEIWAAESNEPTAEPAAKPDPVVRAYGEPVAERQDPERLNEHVEDPGDPDGVFREQQRRRYSQVDETVEVPAAKTKKRHPFLKFLLLLVILAAATAGVFWYGSYKADQNDKTTQQTAPAPAPKQQTAPVVTTKQYDSSNFSLSLSYPSTWTLNDTTSKLTITSPDTQLPLADGSTKAVRVVFAIQPKQTAIANYPASAAVAALASDKLAYAKPNPNQRAQTYLSYLGYHGQNGLDALFVTGDNGYQQGQAVPQSDLTQADPLISVSFVTCTDTTCATGTTTAQTLLAGKWLNTQASKDVASIIKSIKLD